MTTPSHRRTPLPPPQPARPPGPPVPAGPQDRIIRALISLVDDLTVEREEHGLLRSMLEHVVGALDLAGGMALLLGPAAAGPLAGVRRGAVGRAAPPLRARRRALGSLVLHAAGPPPAPALDAELLEVLGKQVGTGIENVRLFGELRASSARVEVLHRIAGAVTSGRKLRTIVPAFAAELATLQAFDRLACGFVNETGDYIEMASHPEGTSWGLGGVLPVVGSGPGFAALNNKAVLQRDLVHEHRYLEDMRLLEEGLRSYVLLPLSSRGQAIGVLALGSTQGGAFDESTLARLQPLAGAVALAFENARLVP